MTTSGNRLQQRLTAVALLAFVLGAAILAVVMPVQELHRHYDQANEEATDRLTRYRRVAATRPAIESAIKAVEESSGRQFYLKGTSPNLIGAELQTLVTKIAEAHGGKLSSSQIVPASETDKEKESPVLKTTLNLQMAASIIPLQLILHAIETHEPYLFVDKLTVNSNLGRGFRPQPGIQPEYQVQLSISAYALRRGAGS